eukprot:1185778-Prorocentrum_minimum.AAC.3
MTCGDGELGSPSLDLLVLVRLWQTDRQADRLSPTVARPPVDTHASQPPARTSGARLVRRENIPERPAFDWSVMRIYGSRSVPRFDPTHEREKGFGRGPWEGPLPRSVSSQPLRRRKALSRVRKHAGVGTAREGLRGGARGRRVRPPARVRRCPVLGA